MAVGWSPSSKRLSSRSASLNILRGKLESRSNASPSGSSPSSLGDRAARRPVHTRTHTHTHTHTHT
eukprot:2587746-Prymnesium_polylepis.1